MQTKEFFNTDFKDFSLYDNVRSIPSVVDGFKPSQRKVIYGILSRGENAPEAKVAQLSGKISEVSMYHHGEMSLQSTIVGMAQTFSGSNNLNLLTPKGQFGSRLAPDAAAARYIFTELSPNFRKAFKKEDDVILNYLDEENVQIEPDFYLPIIPMVLVNGARGMGTGFAVNILNYNPEEIRKNILTILAGKTPSEPLPWFKDFKGSIEKINGQTIIKGKLDVENTTTIKISELPVGYYQDDYRKVLNRLEDEGFIKDYDDNSTEEGFNFIVNIPRSTSYLDLDKLYDKFKLVSRETENFTLWTENNKIKCFKSPQEIIDHFVVFRLQKYEERRKKIIEIKSEELKWLNEKLRFIEFYIKNSEMFSKKNKKELIALLESEKFENIDKLLNIRIYNLTGEEINSLKDDINKVSKDINFYEKTTNVELYKKELEEVKF